MSITASVTLANTIENWYDPNDSAPNWSNLAVSSETSTHLTVSSSFNGMAFSLEITGAFASLGGGATLGNYISSGATVTALSLTTSDGVESFSSSGPISLQLLLQNLSSNSSSGLQQIFSGNDVFVGATSTNNDNSNDHVFGYEGNDTFTGNSTSGPYHDLFDGGNGIDTAAFRGNLANYNIASSYTNLVSDGVTVFNGSTITVTDSVSNRDGAKDLAHVERLQFADVNVALDTDGATSAGGIYRLYQATFDRTPDLGGLGYWIERADNGQSAVSMAEDFTWSQEFQQLYGVTTKDNFMTGADITALVTGFYGNVLGRSPDQGGLSYYVSVINSHEKTVGRVLAEISDSPENYAATIGQIQSGIQYELWNG